MPNEILTRHIFYLISDKLEKDPSVVAWEKWMVEKAKKLRIEQEKKVAEVKQKEEEESRKLKEKVLYIIRQSIP